MPTKEVKKRIAVGEDIKMIDEAIASDDIEFVKSVHKMIDGKYQACINMWGKGMYAFDLDYGFVYSNLDLQSLKENLMTMRPKLQSFMEGWNEVVNGRSVDSGAKVVVNNTNTNSVSINLSFEEAFQKIEDMEGLTQEETEQIQERISQLEKISNESISKKKKWERIKPILEFALTKSADVALVIIKLISQLDLVKK